MGKSTNRSMSVKMTRATSQRVDYAMAHMDLTPSRKDETREEANAALASMKYWAEHFGHEIIKRFDAGTARGADELHKVKAGALPMGQQFTQAARTDRKFGTRLLGRGK